MKYLTAIILLVSCFQVNAQDKIDQQSSTDTSVAYNQTPVKLGNKKQLDLFYNWYFPGRNISLQYVHYFGRQALTTGIKYHINGKDKVKSDAYQNKFYASSFIEHVGISIGYQLDFKRPSFTYRPAVNPFLFANIEYGYLGIRDSYETINPNNPSNLQIETEYYDNFYLFEYSIGLGITAKLYNRLHLNGGAGFSLATFKPSFMPSGNSLIKTNRPITGGAFIYRIGLSYLLK